MKRFNKTLAGKTTLFIICMVSIMLFGICVLGGLLMAEEDIYTRTSDQTYEELVSIRMQRDIYDEISNPQKDHGGVIEYGIYNGTGKLLRSSPDYQDREDTFRYVIISDEEGRINEIFPETDVPPEAERYQIVKAYVADMQSDSYYSFMKKAVDIAYRYRYAVYYVGALALLLGIMTFSTLMAVSGRRNDTEEICPGPLNAIPFDLLLTAVMLSGTVIIYACSEMIRVLAVALAVALAILTVMVMTGAFIGLSMSAACRIKQKTLFTGSFVFKLFGLLQKLTVMVAKFIGRVLKQIWSFIGQVPLVYKTVLILFGSAFLEMMILFNGYNGYVSFWFFKTAVVIAAVLYVSVCLKRLQQAGKALAAGDLSYRVDTKGMIMDLKEHGEDLNRISKGMSIAVEQRLKSERMKTELITNVSHDIKTPLTSIISYADLISKEKNTGRKAKEYAAVLLKQSERLKRLLEDLVEASKASTGNLEIVAEPFDLSIFVGQMAGEYDEKMTEKGLTLVLNDPKQETMIMADGRRMWRIMDNLMNNVCKYAQSNTRVYLSMERSEGSASLILKNTSRDELNIAPEELMERFTRGDSSRNTEGNGLGLSIARSMTELQGGKMDILIDGDLFKVILTFPLI